MGNIPGAPTKRERLNFDIALHSDAELLALGQLWERACAEVDALERDNADAWQISAGIMRKTAIELAIRRLPCRSPDGALVLLRTALEVVWAECGDDMDENWKLVEHAVAALGNLSRA